MCHSLYSPSQCLHLRIRKGLSCVSFWLLSCFHKISVCNVAAGVAFFLSVFCEKFCLAFMLFGCWFLFLSISFMIMLCFFSVFCFCLSIFVSFQCFVFVFPSSSFFLSFFHTPVSFSLSAQKLLPKFHYGGLKLVFMEMQWRGKLSWFPCFTSCELTTVSSFCLLI